MKSFKGEKELRQDITILEQQLEKAKKDRLTAIRKRLMQLNTRAIGYKKKLSEVYREQEELREEFCEIDGHSWTPWIESPGLLDRTWEYTRTCIECGTRQFSGEYELPNGLDRNIDVCADSVWKKLPGDEQIRRVLEIKGRSKN